MTPQEELKEVISDIELLEAEIESNVEEAKRINPLSVASLVECDPYFKREHYLRLRNAWLEKKLKKLRTKKQDTTNFIEWERRTS